MREVLRKSISSSRSYSTKHATVESMKDNFPKSLAFVLKNEGGNDDDPADHGGRTSRGITQREYDAWRTEHSLPTQDVWVAPQSDIDAIYHDEYWEPLCDDFPSGIDYLYFDMAVN